MAKEGRQGETQSESRKLRRSAHMRSFNGSSQARQNYTRCASHSASRGSAVSASEGAPSRLGLMTDAGIDAIQTTLEGRRTRRRMRAARRTAVSCLRLATANYDFVVLPWISGTHHAPHPQSIQKSASVALSENPSASPCRRSYGYETERADGRAREKHATHT